MSAAMATVPEPEDNDFEEPEELALRRALGIRPVYFPDEHPHADQRSCPSWCLYGEDGNRHEVDPKHPFEAFHGLGFGPTVAATRYRGGVHSAEHYGQRFVEAAHLDLNAGQRGQDEPVVSLHLRAEKTSLAALGEKGLKLTLTDTKELIAALAYLVDVLEGRREPMDRTL